MTRITALCLSVALVLAITSCREGESKSSSGGETQTSTTSSGSVAAGTGSGTGTTGATGTGMSVTAKSDAAPAGAEVTTASGLKYQDLVVGTGEEATIGRTVSVHYTGWLTDGTKIDSSVDRGQPIEFPLGTPGIIRGWNEGLTGMKVGGKRHLVIPANLGYGAAGKGPVPPDATLVFDVELVGVK